jgi:hypothetical protein
MMGPSSQGPLGSHSKSLLKPGDPIIPATQEAEIRSIVVQSQPRKTVLETLHKKGLVKWLKVYALSSSPSAAKKKNKVLSSLGSLVLPQLFYIF